MADNLDQARTGAGREKKAEEGSEQLRPVVPRREFMAGAGAGLAVGAVVVGGIAVATRPAAQTQPSAVVTAPGAPVVAVQPGAPVQAPAPGQSQQAAQTQALPLNMRKVDLNIDRAIRTVTVDVRESLWESMVYRLNLSR